MKRFKDKNRTLTGEALDQYLRKHKNIQQLAETLIKVNEIDAKRKPKPLSDEEIKELIVNKVTDYELCRAIEERHGIK